MQLCVLLCPLPSSLQETVLKRHFESGTIMRGKNKKKLQLHYKAGGRHSGHFIHFDCSLQERDGESSLLCGWDPGDSGISSSLCHLN